MPLPSPFPPPSIHPGQGKIHLSLLPPATPTFKTLSFSYPLKLVNSTPHKVPSDANSNERAKLGTTENSRAVQVPEQEPGGKDGMADEKHEEDGRHKQRGQEGEAGHVRLCPLLFLLTYGGGLLAGDAISISLVLDPGTRLSITTQGMTKIFRPASPSPAPGSTFHSASTSKPRVSSQTLKAEIGEGAALWLAPDPCQPFADSAYTQSQVFAVVGGGSVGLVDWVVEGRSARGERWDCEGWKGRNEILQQKGKGPGSKRLLVRDSLVLTQPGLKARMGEIAVVGTMLLYGPLFSSLGRFFVGEFGLLPRIGARDWTDEKTLDRGEEEQWRKRRQHMEKKEGVCWTACQVRGCAVVKVMAPGYQAAREWLSVMLAREGTVGKEFGPGGVMFVR